MIRNKSRIKGFVRITVLDASGEVKRFPKTWWQQLLHLPARKMIITNHNIVGNEGDALVADVMSDTNARQLVDTVSGHIEVGTGFTAENKTTFSCVTPVGSPEILDATYPKLKGVFAATDDNVVQYRATFEAGDLNDNGIDEAALLNSSLAAASDGLAYAQITPSVNVATSDTLQVDWELTFLGS